MTQTDSKHNGESDYLEATSYSLNPDLYYRKLNSNKVIDTELGPNEGLTCGVII